MLVETEDKLLGSEGGTACFATCLFFLLCLVKEKPSLSPYGPTLAISFIEHIFDLRNNLRW